MVAVRGTADAIDALLSDRVALGARNGVDDWALTGAHDALASLHGRPIPVTGPWHAPAMATAGDALRAALPPPGAGLACRYLLNEGGRPAVDAADVHAHLVRQLTHPADWYATVRALEDGGVTDVITVGPGRVLRGQLRRIAPGLHVVGTDHPRDLEQVLP